MNTDLAFATDNELIEELFGRFEHAVLCGMKLPTDDKYVVYRRWKGNTMTCCGLANAVGQRALVAFDEDGTHFGVGADDSNT